MFQLKNIFAAEKSFEKLGQKVIQKSAQKIGSLMILSWMLFSTACGTKMQTTSGGSNSGGIGGQSACTQGQLTYDMGASIVGGSDSDTNSLYKKLSVLIYFDQTLSSTNRLENSFCTGILIENDVVLTAAHCLAGKSVNNLALTKIIPNNPSGCITDSKLSVDTYTTIDKFSIHPKYTGLPAVDDDITVLNKNYYDVALIKLHRALGTHGSFPLMNMSTQLMLANPIKAAGYGRTEASLKVVDTSSVAIRETYLSAMGSTESWMKDLQRSDFSEYLFIDQRQGHGTCQGDSGSGLFLEYKGQAYLIGLASIIFNAPNSTTALDCKQFAAYSNLNNYNAWITSTKASFSVSTAAAAISAQPTPVPPTTLNRLYQFKGRFTGITTEVVDYIDRREPDWQARQKDLLDLGATCNPVTNGYRCYHWPKETTPQSVIDEVTQKYSGSFIDLRAPVSKAKFSHDSEIYREWEIEQDLKSTWGDLSSYRMLSNDYQSKNPLIRIVLPFADQNLWMIVDQKNLLLTAEASRTESWRRFRIYRLQLAFE